jgi:hypothetical protein
MTLAHNTDRIESESDSSFAGLNGQIANSLRVFMQIRSLRDILEMEGRVLFRRRMHY